jgi:hypothetical protein
MLRYLYHALESFKAVTQRLRFCWVTRCALTQQSTDLGSLYHLNPEVQGDDKVSQLNWIPHIN